MYHQNIVIVGAGIIGLSTAYALLKQGATHVTVVEQAAVDHRRGSSHGPSRLLRFEYGSDPFYSKLMQVSLTYWRNLERIAQQRLYTPTGLLVLGKEGDNFTQPSYHVMRKLDLPSERISRQSCRERFPQFRLSDFDVFTFNKEAGILHASQCLRTLKLLIIELGGTICERQRVTQMIHDSHLRPVRLRLENGDEIAADRVVLATGAWVHRLLGELRLPVRLTRQFLLYFANLPLSSFKLSTFPSFIADELYGFPIDTTAAGGYGQGWLKAASHSFGLPVDPDDEPVIDHAAVEQVVSRLRSILPALNDAQLVQVDACVYDVSPDEDFILDYLPDDPRIVFAAGLTGHSFKFGLLLGELLGCLTREVAPLVPMERFQLARFTHQRLPSTAYVA